jgi:hypothetical protein
MPDLSPTLALFSLDGALLFLASNASTDVNGVVLPMDGGNHLRGM